jgi:pimeloyl-ACP methyl ester carboxylesterase
MSGWTSTAVLAQASAPAFEGYAHLPGVDLYYTDTGGAGVPIMLLHANSGGHAIAWEQPELFNSLVLECIARRGLE